MGKQFYVIRMKSTINWGKHQGKTFKWITENEPKYIIWLSRNVKNMSLRFSHDLINWYNENYNIDLIKLRLDSNLPCKKIPISN